MGDPTMGDVVAISKNAESAGELYVVEAKQQPSQKDIEDTMREANAQTRGRLDAEVAEERQTMNMGPCSSCRHDYDGLCPGGWSSGEGDVCHAPRLYDGPCPATAFTTDMEVEDKRDFEKRCLVCWPC